MEVVGYAVIKKGATTGTSHLPLEKFTSERVRVMEFAEDGGVLVLNSEGTGLAMFDKCDVHTSFKCTVEGDIVCPPDYNIMKRFEYMTLATSRKGGYNWQLKEMVIQASLMKGKFHDRFLWQQQD